MNRATKPYTLPGWDMKDGHIEAVTLTDQTAVYVRLLAFGDLSDTNVAIFRCLTAEARTTALLTASRYVTAASVMDKEVPPWFPVANGEAVSLVRTIRQHHRDFSNRLVFDVRPGI